jgi:Holliday junction resolvase RusA-like endonuclease
VTVTEYDTLEPSPLRGDIDNYAKSILDGLNGVAYTDDKLVYKLQVTKR